jgi:hypothetical protein
MWIRDVNLPPELIDAHESGRLVLFVGAGASVDAPSDLPDFSCLTRTIADESNQDAPGPSNPRLDAFLGELDEQGVDVHQRVASILGAEASRPNQLHRAVADLALAGPKVRVVATNYDRHLTTALNETIGRGAATAVPGPEITEYLAPALPMGNDFEGLVYLHGSLCQDPGRLIVTDRDFGRAYLTDAWAARFLERMFAEYTVLFIGYSHSDAVMSYLARGLSRGTQRFALTDEPASRHWASLGITPVGYPVVNCSHKSLTSAVSQWATLSGMRLLDHHEHIKTLVSSAPSGIPEEQSYLEEIISRPDRVHLYTSVARGEQWLDWIEVRPEFSSLFDRIVPQTDCTVVLAAWFVEHYVAEDRYAPLALRTMQKAGGRLGLTLWEYLGRRICRSSGDFPQWALPWLPLLIQDEPVQHRDWLERIMSKLRWPRDRSAALMLFDHLVEPQIRPGRFLGLHGDASFDIWFRGTASYVPQAWADIFSENLADAASDVMPIIDRHLRRLHQLLELIGQRESSIMTRYSRSAIESHGQDGHPQMIDVLINAARDCLQIMLEDDSGCGTAYLKAWALSDVPLMRRLAIHGWAYRTDVDATAKLEWLMGSGLLFVLGLHHEVFRLIAVALPEASPEATETLVTHVLRGPGDERTHRDQAIFDALAWIVRHRPELASAARGLAGMKEVNTDLTERENLDFLFWSESGWFGPQPPMTTEALHKLIGETPSGAIEELLRYQGVSSPIDGPTWEDALGVVKGAIAQWPEDGFALLDEADDIDVGIVCGVVEGWSAATLPPGMPEKVLARLGTYHGADVTGTIARMLRDGGGSPAAPTKWHELPSARSLATQLWSQIRETTPINDSQDWVQAAINHPAGWFAEFWTQAVAGDWRAAGEGWSGLSSELREGIEPLFVQESYEKQLVEVLMASQTLFYFAADRVWCLEYVLPLLDWSNAGRAQRAWQGFLTCGRWGDQLLAAGLLKQFMAAAVHADDFPQVSVVPFRSRLIGHLAGIAVSSESDPAWVKTLTTGADEAFCIEWMESISRELHRLPGPAVENQWNRWMRDYWKDRLKSVPKQLTKGEASAMSGWVIYLTDSIAEGVELATSHLASVPQPSGLLGQLTEERVARGPSDFVKLVGHLLNGTEPPVYEESLKNFVEILKKHHPSIDIRGIVEQAMRLGFSDASSW